MVHTLPCPDRVTVGSLPPDSGEVLSAPGLPTRIGRQARAGLQ